MAKSSESGPVYGVELIDSLPLINSGSMRQAMPSASDLESVSRINMRTAAGYEILLSHYRKESEAVDRLKNVIRNVIHGKWCVTDLQEAIGDL